MKLETAIAKLCTLTGASDRAVPAIVSVFKAAGVRDTVPDATFRKVIAAGDKLKALGIR